MTAPSYAKTFTLTPRPSAAATNRNAVVEAAASYGASMMATVSVRSAMISSYPRNPRGGAAPPRRLRAGGFGGRRAPHWNQIRLRRAVSEPGAWGASSPPCWSMPDGLGARLDDQVDQRVDGRLAHAGRHLARLDAALPQREVVREHVHAARGERVELRSARAGACREHTVLDEEDRDRPSAPAQRRGR